MLEHSSDTSSVPLGPDVAIHATIGLAPVVAFISNFTPVLTAISAIFAICWFGVLFYDRFFNKDKNR